MIGAENQYIELFEQCRAMIDGHSTDAMNAHRDAAFEAFKAHGLPNRKVEEYKYTNLQEVFTPNYGLNLNRLSIPVNPFDAFKCDVPNLSTQLFFVVNDQPLLGSEQEKRPPLPDGVVIDSFVNIARTRPEILTPYYNKLASAAQERGDVSLNTLLAQDGLLVYVPRNVQVSKAVQVINILRSDVDLMVNRRVLIILEANAEIKLLFCDHAADDCEFLTTQVVEAFIGENASLDIYGLEETHVHNRLVSNVFVEQKASSRFNHDSITLHNGLTRNHLNLTFSGEGAECWLGGCVIADKQQHVDNNTLIVHKAAHCTSDEMYKYVLDGEAVGAFAGKVLVVSDAQKTSSAMVNQNLCASKTARMYTQPMLEIYADDVKCSHGSTVGQLNDAALFYMRQRGISLKEAKMLLQFAFVGEVIDKIKLEPLRDRLHYLVEKRFRGELSKCEGCKLCK